MNFEWKRLGTQKFRRYWTVIFSLLAGLIVIGEHFNIGALQWTDAIIVPNLPWLSWGLIVGIGSILGSLWTWKIAY